MGVWPKAVTRSLERGAWRRLGLRHALPSGLCAEVASRGDWVLYNDIFVDGEYDEPILAALAATPPGQPFTALDLGANVGFFALRLAHLVRRSDAPERAVHVTCVEGHPRCEAELRRRLHADNGLAREVASVLGLVGRREGRSRISDRAFHPMRRIAGPRERGAWVDYVDLERTLPGSVPIALLKCDVEGSELDFLESYPALLRRVQSAVLELHPGLCDAARCAKLLDAAGLRPRKRLRRSPDFCVEWFARG